MPDPDHELTAPSSSLPSAPPLGEGPGSRIGPYRLLQQIGEGGFGAVFLAEQEKPVARKVALKIIKLGMDTRQVVARFEQERQALAILDHPHIARVIDAGATGTGRPYFVMELVQGSPIAEYCDKNQLTIEERLELFVQVCQAVQHAHGKGIIHRDIKPSNVLVTTQDGRPHSKVIDFGIAKATSAKLTDRTLFTEVDQVIGTLLYMSPEQAEGSLDIDTRTDVYSLGVLLYELLTGSTPFWARALEDKMYSEIQRMVREVEPPKPSTRLHESRDTLVRIATNRRVEPKRLGTMLRGELDWIVMKALEKDRARRYESASGLASDIRRHLDGEAVVAAPPSTSYRFRKFVRRNRALVSAGAAVAAALLVGAVGFAWQARKASAQRDRAIEAEKETKKRADELALVADFQSSMLKQIDSAKAGKDLTDDVKARFAAALAKAELPEDERSELTESFDSHWSRVNATDAAVELIDRTILKPAIVAIDVKFKDQPVVDAALRQSLGLLYLELGSYDAAKPLLERALETRRRVLGEEHPDTLTSIGNFGILIWRQGHLVEAMPYLQEELENRRRLIGEDDPSTLTAVNNMAGLLAELGRPEEAMTYRREALEKRRRVLGEEDPQTLGSLSDMGALLWDLGNQDEGIAIYREVLVKRRRVLGEEHPDTLTSISNLGAALNELGQTSEAAACLREVLEKRRRLLGEVHPLTLESIKNLGSVLGKLDEDAEGEALMREALANQQRLLGADHPRTLGSLNNLAVFLIQKGKTAEAEPLCRECLERRRRISGPNHPDTLVSNNVMGYVLLRQDKASEAEPYVREAIGISRRVNGEDHKDTLTYIHNLGMLLHDEGKDDEAEPQLRTVVERARGALGPVHPITLTATMNLGIVLNDLKRYQEAAELLAGAEPEFRNRSNPQGERDLATLLTDLGVARTALKQFDEAESNLLEAHSLWVKTRGEKHGDTRGCIRMLADHFAARDLAQPGEGYDAQATMWREMLGAGK